MHSYCQLCKVCGWKVIRYAPWIISDFIFTRTFDLDVLRKYVKGGKVV